MSVTIEHGSTGARSYTATWTPTVYTITYNLNGGSATNPTSYTIESDEPHPHGLHFPWLVRYRPHRTYHECHHTARLHR